SRGASASPSGVWPTPAGEPEAPVPPARVPPVVGILAFPREVGDARHRLAVAEQDRVAAPHLAVLLRVELDEVRASFVRLADEDGDAEDGLRNGEDGLGPARAALGEEET